MPKPRKVAPYGLMCQPVTGVAALAPVTRFRYTPSTFAGMAMFRMPLYTIAASAPPAAAAAATTAQAAKWASRRLARVFICGTPEQGKEAGNRNWAIRASAGNGNRKPLESAGNAPHLP